MACYKKITGEFVGEINSLTVFRLNICWLCSDIKLHGTDYFWIGNCFQDFWCFQDIFKISEVFLFIEQLRKFPQNHECLWGSRSAGDLDSSFRYQLKIIESSSTYLGFGFVFDFFYMKIHATLTHFHHWKFTFIFPPHWKNVEQGQTCFVMISFPHSQNRKYDGAHFCFPE